MLGRMAYWGTVLCTVVYFVFVFWSAVLTIDRRWAKTSLCKRRRERVKRRKPRLRHFAIPVGVWDE